MLLKQNKILELIKYNKLLKNYVDKIPYIKNNFIQINNISNNILYGSPLIIELKIPHKEKK